MCTYIYICISCIMNHVSCIMYHVSCVMCIYIYICIACICLSGAHGVLTARSTRPFHYPFNLLSFQLVSLIFQDSN